MVNSCAETASSRDRLVTLSPILREDSFAVRWGMTISEAVAGALPSLIFTALRGSASMGERKSVV